MKILIGHNTYQQRGGEDVVFEQESAMLEAAGYDIRRFLVHNDHIRGLRGKVAAARSIISNEPSIAALRAEVLEFAPDVVHIHNFFPTLSPAAIEAVAQLGVPIVLTLHNYRLICPGVLLMRNGKPCEDCIGNHKLPAIVHGCYRSSKVGSTLVAAMGLYFKHVLKRYSRALTLIAMTDFAKARFVADGLPAENITIRGNFVADSGAGPPVRERRIVYVGRLSVEKGLDTLLEAARDVDGVVEMIGDGPERERLEALAPRNVVFRGHLGRPQVLERIQSATALALPSHCYESFPMVVLEAMASGTAVLASQLGSLAEIIANEESGLLLPADDVAAWHRALQELLQFPDHAVALGARGRAHFLERHSLEMGVTSLARIYTDAKKRMRDQPTPV
jgi:glycosyltransferase involved in cell wall biosynthesis